MSASKPRRIGVIGGGAAGYFAAIACAEAGPGVVVTILEAADQSLQKVRISGGGRCNVTAGCFDPIELVQAYPRGGKELRGPFSRFQPADTMAWFEERGVALKVEPDGRVFPQSDRSATIVDCLTNAAQQAGVQIRHQCRITKVSAAPGGGLIVAAGASETAFDRVLVATGSGPAGYDIARACGHTIEPCVPSLFSFAVKHRLLAGLAGVSFPEAELQLKVGGATIAVDRGPVLITHWGLSGPATIRLSAWGARKLHDSGYRGELIVNWLGELDSDAVMAELRRCREYAGRKVVGGDVQFGLPKRFWARVTALAAIPDAMTWANVDREAMQRMAAILTACTLPVSGKGEFKDEFVTCGGVRLSEVDFRTMASRVCPGLYFAGEVLDIDGITGGYNFQSAWTTGWIAGRSMAAAS